MSQLQQISLKINPELITKINAISPNENLSDFIRKAVENELNNLNNSIKFEEVKQEKTEQNISKIQKILDEVKLNNMEAKLNDMDTKLQVLNFEILRIFELNKVIYRRTTMSANYAFNILANVKSEEFAMNENSVWGDIVIKNYKIILLFFYTDAIYK